MSSTGSGSFVSQAGGLAHLGHTVPSTFRSDARGLDEVIAKRGVSGEVTAGVASHGSGIIGALGISNTSGFILVPRTEGVALAVVPSTEFGTDASILNHEHGALGDAGGGVGGKLAMRPHVAVGSGGTATSGNA